ncbi:MAG: hypothetical protein MUD09_00095 [Desulfobacterales bacterium]|jgi:hypothetical protein|nr:hypothetical protein [Desulfobacterales bacterium]
MNNILVKPWSEFKEDLNYDIILATVGYENRARFIPKNYKIQAKLKIAAAFKDNQVLDFKKNLNFFNENSYQIQIVKEDRFFNWIIKTLKNIKKNEIKILVDISSMSRLRIAAIIAAIVQLSAKKQFFVEFVYALAKYTPPPKMLGPITQMGPVLSYFAGWFPDPGINCAAIIGLGYDFGKAVGTIEYLEPYEIWALNPIGEDNKYEKAVRKANHHLLDVIDKNKLLNYEVKKPFETFYKIESLISKLIQSSRPTIVPFGPKIFCLISLLIAVMHYPKTSVWRVSSEKYEKILNRYPSGTVVGINAEFGRKY